MVKYLGAIDALVVAVVDPAIFIRANYCAISATLPISPISHFSFASGFAYLFGYLPFRFPIRLLPSFPF